MGSLEQILKASRRRRQMVEEVKKNRYTEGRLMFSPNHCWSWQNRTVTEYKKMQQSHRLTPTVEKTHKKYKCGSHWCPRSSIHVCTSWCCVRACTEQKGMAIGSQWLGRRATHVPNHMKIVIIGQKSKNRYAKWTAPAARHTSPCGKHHKLFSPVTRRLPSQGPVLVTLLFPVSSFHNNIILFPSLFPQD